MNNEFIKKFNFTEDVKCETCIFHSDKCKREIKPMELCRFWTDENGRRPCRLEKISICLEGLDCVEHPEIYIDTKNKKIFISKTENGFAEKYDKNNSIEFMNAPEKLCYTEDWDLYVRGSIFPKYKTPCNECKFRYENKCLHPQLPEHIKTNLLESSNDCFYWANKDNIKAPYTTGDPDSAGRIFIDTFEKKVYDILYHGKPVGLFGVSHALCDLKYKRDAKKSEYYDEYKLPKPRKIIVDWEQYKLASINVIESIWNNLTTRQKMKTLFDEDYLMSYEIIKNLGKIITEKEFNSIIKYYNKLVNIALNKREELYLPGSLIECDTLWEEISDEEEIIEIEKEWVKHTVTYKTKFGKYYQYSYEGNYNWRRSYEMVEVNPKEEMVTVYKEKEE